MRKLNLLGAILAALYGSVTLGILTVNSSEAEARGGCRCHFQDPSGIGLCRIEIKTQTACFRFAFRNPSGHCKWDRRCFRQ
jgi:hypothetical protein